jgi:hypothetical protein
MSTSDSVVIPNNKSKEPAVATGSIISILSSVSFLLSQTFPELRGNKTVYLIFIFAYFFVPLITGFLIRRKVWSPKSVQVLVDEVEKATKDSIQMTKDGSPLGYWKSPPSEK